MNDDPKLCRIALFFHDLRVGGAERVMLQIAQGLLDLGYNVDLVLARVEGPLLSEVPSKSRMIDFGTSSPITMMMKLVKYLRAERPTVLLSPFEVTSVIAIVAKKMSRVATRIVIRVSVNLSLNKRVRWKKIVERMMVSLLYPLADRIVAVSRGVAEDLAAYSRIPLESIKVIYNPVISDQLFQAMEKPSIHPFFVDQFSPVILGVGRLEEQKDFPTLLKAFDRVRKTTPSRLIILGDGEDRDALESLIDSLGLKGWVDLPGFVLNPFAIMKKVSVFVLSSKWEGLPSALIQALACGCPVVSTDCPSGPSEILDRGKYGYLVPVGEAKAMAKAIESALMGNVCKPSSDWLKQFQADVVIQQYEAILCA